MKVEELEFHPLFCSRQTNHFLKGSLLRIRSISFYFHSKILWNFEKQKDLSGLVRPFHYIILTISKNCSYYTMSLI